MHAVRQVNKSKKIIHFSIDFIFRITSILLNYFSIKTILTKLKHLKLFNLNEQTSCNNVSTKFFLGATTTVSSSLDITTPNPNKPEKFLVTSSIDLNASDSLGRTCIHHLVQPFPDGSYTSNIELLRLLHSSGASLTKHDLAGLSPLQYGAINGCQHLCDELTKLTNEQKDSISSNNRTFLYQ